MDMKEDDLMFIYDNIEISHSMVKILRVYSEFNENDYVTIEMLPVLEIIENKLERVLNLF